MELRLEQDQEALRSQFFALNTTSDVAKLLEINYKTLLYYAYRLNPQEQYTRVSIRKRSGGERTLLIPISPIKILQSKLLQVFQSVYQPRNCVHGFTKSKSIVTNAEVHMQKRKRSFVLNVDIQDFFPSINFGRVRGLLMAKPYLLPPDVATVIAQLCCVDNQLPQGAPTSPIISNMICSKLDAQLQNLAKENKCFYTRYADDLTFSTSLNRFPTALARVEETSTGKQVVAGSTLNEIVEANGFKLHPDKVHLQRSDRRQQITGITVNKIPNVPKKHIDQLRAIFHSWEKIGYEEAAKLHSLKHSHSHKPPHAEATTFAKIVKGKIEYIGMVRGTQNPIYRRYRRKLGELDPAMKKAGLEDMRTKIFISYSHSDTTWLDQLKTHLKPYERNYPLNFWDDTKISPGAIWYKEIEASLNEAKAAVLLVTPEFLESDFIYKHELPPLLSAAQKDGLVILWIAIKTSSFDQTEIKNYQALNDPSKPISSLRGNKREAAFVDICKKIMTAVGATT